MVEIPRDKLVELDTALANAMALSVGHREADGSVRQVCDMAAVYSARDLVIDLLVEKPAPPVRDPKSIWDVLTQKQRDMIDHALGGDERHRNYYCTSTEDPDWELLFVYGLAKRGQQLNDRSDRYYHVTDLGIQAFEHRELVLRPLEIRELLRRFTPTMHVCFKTLRCDDLQTMRGLIRRHLVQDVTFSASTCTFKFTHSSRGAALAKHLGQGGKESAHARVGTST